jgi:hypothetical protein
MVKLYALRKSSDGGLPPTKDNLPALCGSRERATHQNQSLSTAKGSIVSAGAYFPMLL